MSLWESIWEKSEAIIKEWSGKLDPFPLLELRFGLTEQRARGIAPEQHSLIFMTPSVLATEIVCVYDDLLLDLRNINDETNLTDLENAMNSMPTLFQLYSIGCRCLAYNVIYWEIENGWMFGGRPGHERTPAGASKKVYYCPECGKPLPRLNDCSLEVADRFGRLGI